VTIDDLRRRIDAIDEQLVALLDMRAACAMEIGRIKRRERLPVFQPDREAAVAGHVRKVNDRLGGPLSGDAVARLFERIIDEARRLEADVEDEVTEAEATALRQTDAHDDSRTGGAPAGSARQEV
jgi:chorismate mutase